MIEALSYIGAPLSGFFTAYATGKLLTILGEKEEKLNPLATGDPQILEEYTGRHPQVLILVPSYNDRSIDEALPKWFNQNYPRYQIVVAEDGGKRYDNIGEPQDTTHHEYTLLNGERQRVRIERLAVKGSIREIVVVRRGDRRGFKPGALNNVLHLVETGALRDLAGVERPDYVMIVDADHEPGRNRFLRLHFCEAPECREWENKPLPLDLYERIDKRLRLYEELGRELLGIESYRLRSGLMDDPDTLVTRAVELIEYHRRFIPQLAVVQGYQNHYADPDRGLDLLVRAASILAQYNLALRSPRVRIEVIDKHTGRVWAYEPRPRSRLLRLLNKLLTRKYRLVNMFEEDGRLIRVYVSNHMFPLFTGSSGIIRGDLLQEYKFADGIFNSYQSVTEDWELSIRLQRDGYLIVATHQLETWGRPPEDNEVYKKQQYRWAYGTTRDIKHHLRAILGNKNLTLTEKLGFLAQQSHYMGGSFVLLAFIGMPLTMFIKGFHYFTSLQSILITALQSTYYGIATFVPERERGTPFITILYRILSMIPVYSVAVLKALLGDDNEWVVTRRKKWGKS